MSHEEERELVRREGGDRARRFKAIEARARRVLEDALLLRSEALRRTSYLKSAECIAMRRRISETRALAEAAYRESFAVSGALSDTQLEDIAQSVLPKVAAFAEAIRDATDLNIELLAATTTRPRGSNEFLQLPVGDLLDWEVLPPEEVTALGLACDRLGGASAAPDTAERLRLLASLSPKGWYRGLSLGVRVYVVATFPQVAIADSGEYGNALYYYECCGDEWMTVFRRDKRQAQSSGARRVIHRGDWEQRVRLLIGEPR